MPIGERERDISCNGSGYRFAKLLAGLGFFRAVSYLLRFFAIWRAEDHYAAKL